MSTVILSQVEVSDWFVGFWEGDGSVIVSRRNTKLPLSLQVSQKELSIIHKLKDHFGGWAGAGYNGSTLSDPDAAQFRWSWQGRDPALVALNMLERVQCFGRVIQLTKILAETTSIQISDSELERLSEAPRPDMSIEWLTGFWEAEGSACILEGRYLRLQIGQKDRTVLDFIASKFGGKVLMSCPYPEMYIWYSNSKTTEALASRILEYTEVPHKREQLEKALLDLQVIQWGNSQKVLA